MDEETLLPSSLRRGRRQIGLGSLLKMNGKDAKDLAMQLRATSAAMKEIGKDRSKLMLYIRSKSHVMNELMDVWIEALYGPGALTEWFKKSRPLESKGIAGGPELGVPVDTGALQEALTYEGAEGAIHQVFISKDGRLSFRYGAAPQKQYTDKPSRENPDEVGDPDPNESYLDEINRFYSQGGVGFFEVGLDDMSKKARLLDLRAKISEILSREARAYIDSRVKA
jgi:hypothetical protein